MIRIWAIHILSMKYLFQEMKNIKRLGADMYVWINEKVRT